METAPVSKAGLGKRFYLLFSVVLALVLAIPALALADVLKNDLRSTANSIVNYTAGDPAISVGYYIHPNNTCDAADGTAAAVSLRSSSNGIITKNITISPETPHIFTACGEANKKFFSFSSERTLAPGDYVIEATVVDEQGLYNTDPATFTLRVSSPRPETNIDPDAGPPSRTNGTSASFAFSSDLGTSFECRLDELNNNDAFGACTSPKDYSALTDGSHTFQVRAKDSAGRVDPTPAERTWIVDTIKPQVIETSPASAQTHVDPSVGMVATFSEPMKPSTLSTSTVKLFTGGTATAPIEATVSYDTATKQVTLTPNAPLSLGTRYVVMVTSGARDLAGNALDQDPTTTGNQAKLWSFATAPETTPPKVESVIPAENATGVSPEANIEAFFSEAVRSNTVNAYNIQLYKTDPSEVVHATITYDASTRKATLDPSEPLLRGKRYTVLVRVGVRDLAGNALDQDQDLSNGRQTKRWIFTVKG